jgi:hypothetical protein
MPEHGCSLRGFFQRYKPYKQVTYLMPVLAHTCGTYPTPVARPTPRVPRTTPPPRNIATYTHRCSAPSFLKGRYHLQQALKTDDSLS